MRRTVAIMVCLASIGIWPSGALAAPATITDVSFSAGTPNGTQVGPAGELRLAPNGPLYAFASALPAGWTATPWDTGGAATFVGGQMLVNGALVAETATGSSGQVLVANATLASAPSQQLGFATDFNAPPWAMFSTGGGGLAVGLYARTSTAPGIETDTPITGVNPAAPHNYRIEWAPGQIRFYVDDVLQATQAVTFTTALRPAVSDFVVGGPSVSVNSIQSGPYTTGTFVSRVIDTTDTRAKWGALTPSPAPGTGLSFETRTSLNGTTWSPWHALGANGKIESPVGRYIQYSVTVTAANPTLSPTLQSVAIGYEVDEVPPRTVINSLTAFQTTATVTFSSPDADVAGFQCSLDGGAFTTCTSPTAFSGLAVGPHAVSVRAIDQVGNVGQVVTRAFTAVAPPLPPPSEVAIRLGPTSLQASRSGLVPVRVRCVTADGQCTVQIRLRRGGNTVARRTVTIPDGGARTVQLRLSARTRRALTRCRTVRVTASLLARDSAGDRQTLRRGITIRRRGCET